MLKKFRLFLYFFSVINIFSGDYPRTTPTLKLVFYEAAKKGLLLNIIYTFKNPVIDDVFLGTSIGFDIKRFSKKNFSIGLGSTRLDVVNMLFDFSLFKCGSDVIKFKYGGIFDTNKDIFLMSFCNNLVISGLYFKVFFFKINLFEFRIGDIVYFFKSISDSLSSLLNDNEERALQISTTARNTLIASILVPSFQIDIRELISFIRERTSKNNISDVPEDISKAEDSTETKEEQTN